MGLKKTHQNTIFLILFTAFGALLASCGKSGASGELVGAGAKNFKSNEVPYGMVYIPGGSFIMGQTDQDVLFGQAAQNKEVTVSPFFMDETEITNSEYRQFVNWVRDSTLIALMTGAEQAKFLVVDKSVTKAGNNNPVTPPSTTQPAPGAGIQTGNNNPVPPPSTTQPAPGAGIQKGIAPPLPRPIDWRKVGVNGANLWKSGLKGDVFKNAKKSITHTELGDPKLDDRKFTYGYTIFDAEKAAAERDQRGKNNIQNADRTKQVFKDTVGVYPDTLVWKAHLFKRSHNEPMIYGYFSHPAYNNYPVVGISWRQARAFSVWRGKVNDSYRAAKKLPKRMPYSLPTEAEFEYAARGGRVGTTYPWGGPYPRNAKGCLMANFKPARGRFADDGATFTVNVKSYFPNDFGLFNMAGNVAEWTNDAYNVSAYNITNTLNPVINNAGEKRKVVRGGSWNDNGYFLQNSVRNYEMELEQTAYIGFRCVTPYIGRDIKDK
ncbi:MAG: SUMF1/EgtB/PvdO family nonheme iron enzyme [Sphingobacteriales bacterium]|nr:SUMF1/EgtB/PvdO family nonheme iron enzyme [Sphingobacteriales bacterium]